MYLDEDAHHDPSKPKAPSGVKEMTKVKKFLLLHVALLYEASCVSDKCNYCTDKLYFSFNLLYGHTVLLLLLILTFFFLHIFFRPPQRQTAGLKIIEASCNGGEHDSCFLAGAHYINPRTIIITINCCCFISDLRRTCPCTTTLFLPITTQSNCVQSSVFF
jgi:hypothetical protein